MGIIKFYYDESSEKVFEASKLTSFKVTLLETNTVILNIVTTEKTYSFQLCKDDRWNANSMIDFFNKNFEKVIEEKCNCEISTFKQRIYVYFDFYTNSSEDKVDHGQFTGCLKQGGEI